MSRDNKITNDHFKVGGDGHSGENILHEVNKQQFTQAQAVQEENASLIPNQHQHQQAETPAPRGDQDRGGNATPSSNSSASDY
jgi:hypothetical protein